jgi:hypothetical protein
MEHEACLTWLCMKTASVLAAHFHNSLALRHQMDNAAAHQYDSPRIVAAVIPDIPQGKMTLMPDHNNMMLPYVATDKPSKPAGRSTPFFCCSPPDPLLPPSLLPPLLPLSASAASAAAAAAAAASSSGTPALPCLQ